MSSAISKVVPAGYGYVGLAASSVGLVLVWQSLLVGRARKAAKIPYPQLYATPEEQKASREGLIYNCTQRAHQNTLETLPFVLFASLWTGLAYPRFAAIAMGGWVAGRVVYTLGYTTGTPGKRNYGAFGSLALISLVGSSFYTSYRFIADGLY